MDLHHHWPQIKRLFVHTLRTSMHYAIVSVDEEGLPHATPIGSLILTEPGKGYYFEVFTNKMPRNLANQSQVCVMAIDSSKWAWLKALLRGRFGRPPGVRLYGVAGPRREATTEERNRWQHRVRHLRWTKGYKRLWQDLRYVRDIEFNRVDPVQIGILTRGLWRK